MSAINVASRDAIPQTILFDPVKKDSQGLDAFDRACIEGDNTRALGVLAGINKVNVPKTIFVEIVNLTKDFAERLFLDAILKNQVTEEQIQKTLLEVNQRDKNNKLPLEKAIEEHKPENFIELFVCGADVKQKTLAGSSLLHLAVCQQEVDIVLLLLVAGLDPNEKDDKGNTLLFYAAKQANMHIVYLLLSYGATLSSPVTDMLIQVAKGHDPLLISSADKLLFLATGAYWLAKGATTLSSNKYLENIPLLIHLLGSSWMLCNQLQRLNLLPEAKQNWKKAVVATGVMGVQLLPATNVVMQIWKTATVAVSAFSGIKAAYNNYAHRSWQAFQKGVIHTVNTVQSLYMLKSMFAFEYSESQLFKKAHESAVAVDDISSYPEWNCDNYKKLFRQETLTHHPDKSTSGMQVVLNAVNTFWKHYCRVEEGV